MSELLAAGRVSTDGQPDGWARRVLEARRGLLLVDGLDEVPAEEREEARRWLCALLDRYPGTRCLATVRPNAVEERWLRGDGFAELTLLPMRDDDIRAFVHAWHNAARLECREEHELLTTLEQDLAHHLERNPALRDLARTPLLCAVICALHRRRRGCCPPPAGSSTGPRSPCSSGAATRAGAYSTPITSDWTPTSSTPCSSGWPCGWSAWGCSN